MEKIIQYFIQELRQAGSSLTKLSVIAALHESFLTKPPSCKVTASTGVLVKCLLDILEDEFCVDEHGNRKEKINNCSLNQNAASSVTGVKGLVKLMTLKCLYEFSLEKENVLDLDVELKKSVLSFLATICDLEKNRWGATDNFRFSPNFTKCVKKYMHNVDYKVQVKVFCEESCALHNVKGFQNYLALYNETDLAEHIWKILDSSQFEVIGLSVASAPSGQDLENCDHDDLVDLLVSQQVAWGRQQKAKVGYPENKDSQGKPLKKTKSSKNDKKSLGGHIEPRVSESVIRKVLNGNLFWVNIGEDSINNVDLISSDLQQRFEINSLELCRFCKQNAIVAALVEGHHEKENQLGEMVIRAKILSVVSGLVTVFGIDYGGVYKVPLSSIFYLPSELAISVIPQQATLADLYDVSPTPVNYSHVELPVAIMTNICRTGEMASAFIDLNLLPVLPVLICCGDSVITSQALRLLTTISKHTDVDCSDDWCQIMISILRCFGKLVQAHAAARECLLNKSSPSEGESASKCSLDPVDKDISPSPTERSRRNDFSSTSLKSPSLKATSPRVKKCVNISNSACSPVREKELISSPMKIQDSKATPTKMTDTSGNSDHKSTNSIKKAESENEKLICECLKLLANLLYKNQSMKEVFYHQNGLEAVLICQRVFGRSRLVCSYLRRVLFNFVNTFSNSAGVPGYNRAPLLGEASDDDNEDDSGFPVSGNGFDLDSSDEEDSDEFQNIEESDASSPNIGDWEKETSFLIKGIKYPHVNNPRYELLEGLDWTSHSLCAIVCGMLNSGQVGVICVGVGKGGVVIGETVSHDMRDQLRLGMDDLMARLVPYVMHVQLQVRFVPVVDQPGDMDDPGTIHRHVIEIVCNPMRGVIHSLKNGLSYYRTGSKTIMVNEQTIRHLIIIDEEQKFMDEIVELQQTLQSLKSDESES